MVYLIGAQNCIPLNIPLRRADAPPFRASCPARTPVTDPQASRDIHRQRTFANAPFQVRQCYDCHPVRLIWCGSVARLLIHLGTNRRAVSNYVRYG